MKPEHFREKSTRACINCGYFGFEKKFRGWGCSKYNFTISMSLIGSSNFICDKFEIPLHIRKIEEEKEDEQKAV